MNDILVHDMPSRTDHHFALSWSVRCALREPAALYMDEQAVVIAKQLTVAKHIAGQQTRSLG